MNHQEMLRVCRELAADKPVYMPEEDWRAMVRAGLVEEVRAPESPTGYAYELIQQPEGDAPVAHQWARRNPEERGEAWLDATRYRLKSEWTRDQLIEWLGEVDPSGTYHDDERRAEYLPTLTIEQAVDLVMPFVEQSRQTPEEMRQGAPDAD